MPTSKISGPSFNQILLQIWHLQSVPLSKHHLAFPCRNHTNIIEVPYEVPELSTKNKHSFTDTKLQNNFHQLEKTNFFIANQNI